jgi:uncharacterized repeat protein (TIGR03803 family)
MFRVSTNGSVDRVPAVLSYPTGELVQRKYDGSFYGTYDIGVFRVTLDGSVQSFGMFAGSGYGYVARAGLVEGADGNFYGTTYNTTATAPYGWGTIFQLTFNYRVTTLHTFTNGNEGAYPQCALVEGPDGALYGTTSQCGSNNAGTVFQMTEDGAFRTLYSFTGGDDGYYPIAGLLLARDGLLYGTTMFGGSNDVALGGDGTVFRISTNGSFTTLASFAGSNGVSPKARLTQGSDGNFYGTTVGGGNGNGTAFRVTTNGIITTLYLFGSVTNSYGVALDGSNPQSRLVEITGGTFFGTAHDGGTNGVGTVFRLTTGSGIGPILQLARSGSGVVLSWNAEVGGRYQVQSTAADVPWQWSSVGTAVVATDAVASVFAPLVSGTSCLYRLAVLPSQGSDRR